MPPAVDKAGCSCGGRAADFERVEKQLSEIRGQLESMDVRFAQVLEGLKVLRNLAGYRQEEQAIKAERNDVRESITRMNG